MCGFRWKAEKWDQYNEEDMRQINEILYSDIVGDAYEKSYANPKYACSWFEPEMGRLLSFLYVEMRSGIPYAFEGRLDYLTILYGCLSRYIRILKIAGQMALNRKYEE